MRLRGRAFFGCLAVAALALAFTPPPQVESGLEVRDIGISYTFGQQITFTAQLSYFLPIQQALLSFRQVNGGDARVEAVTLNPDGTTFFQYDAGQNPLPPFVEILFSYQAVLENGQSVTSAPFYFRYEDNRFPWKSAGDGQLTVHWYDGDQAFGQAALEAARLGLQRVEQVMPISLESPLDVYVYSRAADLHSTLMLGGKEWVAGHADPALDVVMVLVSPGETQATELPRQVPHELARVLLYRSVGAGYYRLPIWLSEGIASLAELSPNPEYATLLALASQSNSLLPLSDLCASFPADSGHAFLAYAESESFVLNLRDTYGNTGLVALTKAYADGLDCELGATRAVGVPLSRLDARWRESLLGENAAGVAAGNLLPYLLLLGLTLIVPVWGAVGILLERRRNARAK
jgi:hypothetical protein